MIRQEMCDNLEKIIVSFIVENTENDYDVGKKLADIIHKQLAISPEDLISGFIDGISECNCVKCRKIFYKDSIHTICDECREKKKE